MFVFSVMWMCLCFTHVISIFLQSLHCIIFVLCYPWLTHINILSIFSMPYSVFACVDLSGLFEKCIDLCGLFDMNCYCYDSVHIVWFIEVWTKWLSSCRQLFQVHLPDANFSANLFIKFQLTKSHNWFKMMVTPTPSPFCPPYTQWIFTGNLANLQSISFVNEAPDNMFDDWFMLYFD